MFFVSSCIFVILILIWWFFFRERPGYPFPNHLMRSYARTPYIFMLIWGIRGIIVLILMGIFLNPHVPLPVFTPGEPKQNVVVAVDLSRSMKTDELSRPRLDIVKDLITRWLFGGGEDQIGLVVFAGKVFSLAPLTHDRSGLIGMIGTLSTDSINQVLPDTSGTNIGDALLLSSQMLESFSGAKQILLLTDGRANIGVDPRLALKYIDPTVQVSTIAVGMASGVTLSYLDSNNVRQVMRDEEGNALQADIDQVLLQEIAQKTGGTYYELSNLDVFDSIVSSLRDHMRSSGELHLVAKDVSVRFPLVFFLVFLALVHAFLIYRVQKEYKIQ